MPGVKLCLPANESAEPQNQRNCSNEGIDNERPWVVANMLTKEHTKERNEFISHAIHRATTWNDKVEALVSALEDDSQKPSMKTSQEESTITCSMLTTMKPLEGQILAILWEIHRSGIPETILRPWNDIQSGTPQDFVTLLSFAATFEANSAKSAMVSFCHFPTRSPL